MLMPSVVFVLLLVSSGLLLKCVATIVTSVLLFTSVLTPSLVLSPLVFFSLLWCSLLLLFLLVVAVLIINILIIIVIMIIVTIVLSVVFVLPVVLVFSNGVRVLEICINIYISSISMLTSVVSLFLNVVAATIMILSYGSSAEFPQSFLEDPLLPRKGPSWPACAFPLPSTALLTQGAPGVRWPAQGFGGFVPTSGKPRALRWTS